MSASWSADSPLRQLFDTLSDPLLLLDRHGSIRFANTAALRLAACEPGMSIDQLSALFGDLALRWVQRSLADLADGRAPPLGPPRVTLPDGRSVRLVWQPQDATHAALLLQVVAGAVPAVSAPPRRIGGEAVDEVLRVFWESPFPATLQDEHYRIVDVNPAYLDFTGYRREALIGLDPVELQPEDDRPASRAMRAEAPGYPGDDRAPLLDRRLIDAEGRERWFRASRTRLPDAAGRPRFLVVLQDNTAEHAARERADRSARELDDWFELSPLGMVLFDDSGLLVRTNPAFDELLGEVPVTLSEAAPSLQRLLAWADGAASADLAAGSRPVTVAGWATQADGRQRRLRSIVRCYVTPGGQRRYMAVIEDRSIEEERDLAQMQIGALMDTAGVGLATFQESSGWMQPGPPIRGDAPPPAAPANAVSPSLLSIGRDVVLPESLTEYERLQQALRQARRAEVRYGIRHAELGLRWLLTRVEPATLASGKRTTSVVTLDITEQHQHQLRNEQLLHEVTTILESTTAGIAYVRGNLLARCNRRFVSMLGLTGRDVAGSSIQELFGHSPQAQRIAGETLLALREGTLFETEFELELPPEAPGEPQWYALSVRRVGPADGPIEAIAVLSDITRLKNQQRQVGILARDRELMFTLSDVGIAFVRDGRLQRANDALAQLTGYPAAELAGLPFERLFVDAADHQRRWAREELALHQYGRYVGERQLRRQDGRLLWVQVTKRLVTEGDIAGGVIASYVNVDDRHRAEQAVALQAERTRAILDSVLVGIVTVGARGIEWMNRSARRMFGGDLTDFLYQPIDAVATDDPEHPFRRAARLGEWADGQGETFECRLKARDGREFWVVGNAVVTGSDSASRQLTYALLDIERRRQAEASTAKAQASLKRIIDTAPMAITLWDAPELRVVQINDAAARTAGRRADELVGRTAGEVLGPELSAERERDMRDALDSRQVTLREYRHAVGGQTQVWDARYVPLLAPDGGAGAAPDQLLLVATDVTTQRAAEEARYEAAVAQREMLVKEVHHRIKNNLQGVAGLLEQIAVRKPEVASAISAVIGQVQAIAQVYGLQVGVTGPLRIKSVVEAITGSVQRAFGRPIELSVEGPAHLWALPESESIPIALTVNALLSNAVRHGRPDGDVPVSCRLESTQDSVRIVIANPGQLPEGFNLAKFRSGITGIGLVRSLLPRRSSSFTLVQEASEVHATVTLMPPGISRLAPA